MLVFHREIFYCNLRVLIYTTTMLDIKFIRENRDIVKQAAMKKHITVDVDKLVALDNDRLDLLREIEALRAEQNAQ